MGRHAADRPGNLPLHADLFSPTPGSAAERAAQSRAAAAFETLVGPHREAVADYVHRLTGGDEALAGSVLKETFYRAAQDPARYPQRASGVRPWLVLTARTVLRDGERFAPAGHDDRPPAVVPARGPQAATTIAGAMDDLASAHRDVLVELFYRGVSLEEAAAVRGVPVEELKSRLYFAMRSLRVVLDQHLADRHDPGTGYRR
ncbi:sigma factor-like helix-turn-helix DNA-binding protein [Actinoplanes friuliensis]|jgi:RNA polymerase sigma-70 factor, ECF subfamily|uniref:RNA polymerase sigma factor SigL n=1 Tax=Actinoplanes friuliensis DSM 7358 TaxID=1246995 RepID=U5WA80_9ACTN|nr:sigma factor-like helix-turn-helix DNA-binding protein [Actinoplanes friuliensis]AGZ44846.1 RNA polymerase sigma factor SigL [Actinoplanes friuliensis DSM 7358]